MKTAEETLRKYFDSDNSVDENAITKAMKEFAIEASKEALKNASEVVNWKYNGGYDCKQAILSESNIPSL